MYTKVCVCFSICSFCGYILFIKVYYREEVAVLKSCAELFPLILHMKSANLSGTRNQKLSKSIFLFLRFAVRYTACTAHSDEHTLICLCLYIYTCNNYLICSVSMHFVEDNGEPTSILHYALGNSFT